MLIDVTDDIVPRPRLGLRQPTLEEMTETRHARGSYDTDRVPEEPMKTCKCGATHPATTEFWHKHPTMRDGLDNRCKACKAKIWEKTKLEKQSAYQQRHESAGLCRQCPRLAVSGQLFCETCLEKSRSACRNRYRLKHGIPLDAPPMRTKPRCNHE